MISITFNNTASYKNNPSEVSMEWQGVNIPEGSKLYRIHKFTYMHGGVNYILEINESDGSWIYGLLPIQSWKDSFHTGFNLDAIESYQQNTGDRSFQNYIDKGWTYYTANFFESDGQPKYYHNKTYPIDIHCPAQIIVTASKLKQFKNHQQLLSKTLDWTIDNMQAKKGYFYYQIKKGMSSKISYMRWSNAFMFNAMAHYYLESNQ